MADFSPTQGRYLAFIHAYTHLHGFPPAESEISAAMRVSPPSVHQMVKTLEKKGLLQRTPGQARSLRVLVPEDDIPPWSAGDRSQKPAKATQAPVARPKPASPPANLYVLEIYLQQVPPFCKVTKTVRRDIEIRGDQTLDDLHRAIFDAFDRDDEHLYEFQFGKRPFDPAGPNYGVPETPRRSAAERDARTTRLDDLKLERNRVFGYLFDFGDNWFHQVEVARIEQAIPTVTYPRVVKRTGKSPPQYAD